MGRHHEDGLRYGSEQTTGFGREKFRLNLHQMILPSRNVRVGIAQSA